MWDYQILLNVHQLFDSSRPTQREKQQMFFWTVRSPPADIYDVATPGNFRNNTFSLQWLNFEKGDIKCVCLSIMFFSTASQGPKTKTVMFPRMWVIFLIHVICNLNFVCVTPGVAGDVSSHASCVLTLSPREEKIHVCQNLIHQGASMTNNIMRANAHSLHCAM